MVASSTIISLAILSSLVRTLCPVIGKTWFSVGVRGALNREWKVRPRRRRFAAMPVVPVARAIDPWDSRVLTAASMAFRINVLQQPSHASRNS